MHIYTLRYHPLYDHCGNAGQQNCKLQLDISRKFFPTWVVWHQVRVHREGMEMLSLETFETQMAKAPSNIS